MRLTLPAGPVEVVDTASDRPALLLLHAFPLRAAMWEAQLAAFAPTHRVIAPDLSGFGGSVAPWDPGGYSMERWADEARAILDALGVRKAVVGGLSMGGYVALAFARRHPDALRALVLADTRADADTEAAREKRRAQAAQIRTEGLTTLRNSLVPALLGATTLATRPEVVARVRALIDAPPQGVLGALGALARRPDSTPLLPRLQLPALVIVGEEDTLTPPALAEAMHAALPSSTLVRIPRAGHLSQLEAPEPFNRALAGFLAGL